MTLVVTVTDPRLLTPGIAWTNPSFVTAWPALLGCQGLDAATIACGCCSSGRAPDGNDCGHICFAFESTRMTFWFPWFEGLVILRFNIVTLLCTSSICACCCRSIWLSIGNNWSGDEVCSRCNSRRCLEFNGSMSSTTTSSFSSWACCCPPNDTAVSIKVSELWGMLCSAAICCSSAFFSMSNLKWRWYLRSAVCICASSFRLMDSRACSCTSCLSDKSLFLSK